MGVTQAFELTKDCEAIKLVDPRKEGPCVIDGSAVSYMKFKATEGRLLLKQLKKMAKEDVSVGIPGPVLRLAHWDQESWSFPSPVATKGLASDLFALHLSTAPDPTLACNTSSTNSTTTQQVSSSTGLLYSASDALPPPSHPPTDVHHELNSARDVVWPLLANVLNKWYDRFYKKSGDFIHYDGPPTTQKAFAHERRQLATKKQHLKLFEYLRIAEARLSQMEANPKLSNSQVSRFKSFLSKVLFPCWIRTRGVDPRATRAIVNELQESHGWKAHQCAGQFDICVGRKARENPDLVVVSTDSDLLFVGAERLFRLQPKGARFYCYPIKNIISHCGLETPEEWVAAAVVSLNDYDPSVGRTSFSTAIKDITEIRKDWNREKSKGRSVDRYVKELCRRKNVHHDAVKKSLDSFVKLVETPLDRYTQGDDEIDESIRRIVYRVEALTLR
jgi:5'-3' exonuclease